MSTRVEKNDNVPVGKGRFGGLGFLSLLFPPSSSSMNSIIVSHFPHMQQQHRWKIWRATTSTCSTEQKKNSCEQPMNYQNFLSLVWKHYISKKLWFMIIIIKFHSSNNIFLFVWDSVFQVAASLIKSVKIIRSASLWLIKIVPVKFVVLIEGKVGVRIRIRSAVIIKE